MEPLRDVADELGLGLAQADRDEPVLAGGEMDGPPRGGVDRMDGDGRVRRGGSPGGRESAWRRRVTGRRGVDERSPGPGLRARGLGGERGGVGEGVPGLEQRLERIGSLDVGSRVHRSVSRWGASATRSRRRPRLTSWRAFSSVQSSMAATSA